MYTKALTQPFITASYKSIILHLNSSEIFSVRLFCEYKSQDMISQVKVAQIYIFIDKTPPLAEGFKSFYQPHTQCCTLQGTHKNITMNSVLAVNTALFTSWCPFMYYIIVCIDQQSMGAAPAPVTWIAEVVLRGQGHALKPYCFSSKEHPEIYIQVYFILCFHVHSQFVTLGVTIFK